MNTGILCDGLRAVDIDVDDAALVGQIEAIAREMLGPAPVRTREGSPRRLLLYRAAEGEPKKRQEIGTLGSIEVLGYGQQFVAYGIHPDGSSYEWPLEGPREWPLTKLTRITEAQELAFRRALRPLLGVEAKAERADASESEPAAFPSVLSAVTEDEKAYGRGVLKSEVKALAALSEGDGRNGKLNAAAYRIGRRIGAGFVDREEAEQQLLEAASECGTLEDRGKDQTVATILSGLESGIANPDDSMPASIEPEPWMKELAAKNDPTRKQRCLRSRKL